uniref:Uncharacterized protein n=1 Tax=Nelumbo nucifera TaxID=4432 RepID=A0A822YZ76_NELNU|nr:TPA_asm: hypothetical protein HUJ06_008184 [Nelumbo nucifera]
MSSQFTYGIRFHNNLKYSVRYCKCGEKCILRVSETPGNPQRLFTFALANPQMIPKRKLIPISSTPI